MDDTMRLVAACISTKGGHKKFELVYRLKNGGCACYAWTDRPGQEDRWTAVSARWLRKWISTNRSQVVEIDAGAMRFSR